MRISGEKLKIFIHVLDLFYCIVQLSNVVNYSIELILLGFCCSADRCDPWASCLYPYTRDPGCPLWSVFVHESVEWFNNLSALLLLKLSPAAMNSSICVVDFMDILILAFKVKSQTYLKIPIQHFLDLINSTIWPNWPLSLNEPLTKVS